MLSYIIDFVKGLFGYDDVPPPDEDEENFIAEELLKLEIENGIFDNNYDFRDNKVSVSNEEGCFEKTGVVTYVEESYVLIDGMLYCEYDPYTETYDVQDVVSYTGYEDGDGNVKVVRIFNNKGQAWGDVDDQVKRFQIVQHFIVGEVDAREGRFVSMKGTNLKFNLDDVNITFVPVKGDCLELLCRAKFDEDNPTITADQVIKVLSCKPVRKVIKTATVTFCSPESVICNSDIFFDKKNSIGFVPQIGCKVIVEAIESNQGGCTWRAIKLEQDLVKNAKGYISNMQNDEKLSFDVEKEKSIEVTHPVIFDKISLNDSASICINVANNSDSIYKVFKWSLLSKRSDSQITIKPLISYPIKLYPNHNINFVVTCRPKFLGSSKEMFVLDIDDFKIKRWVEINVIDENSVPNVLGDNLMKERNEKGNFIDLKDVLNSASRSFVPGVRPVKSPAFVPVRLGVFPIPGKIWKAVADSSNESVYSERRNEIFTRMEMHLPCLLAELNINNYTDKMHTLLFLEEIHMNLELKKYNMPKTFMITDKEYISLEVAGLSEKRPSLIQGDRVIVKDIYDSKKPDYEGFIHTVKGNNLLLKFNERFHETYTGYDVSIEFHFSRTVYRRCHQAINLAVSHLSHNVLFPKRIACKQPQVNIEDIKAIRWYNEKLNDCQKMAVHNVLLGECRPMPYCIYGPPGTGKTMTVIETILQILKLLPDSRILVATPSNSAANLITERLLHFKNSFSSSVIRLISKNVANSENVPDAIKPFCATMDIATESTARNKQTKKDGVNMNCRSYFIGRHRVTIGTCVCLGQLAQMELSRGHFTHVIVDEAGQANEGEIMIPLTFIDKNTGQIILAGDPMQLGPVVFSKFAVEYGLTESYMSRIILSFPYQRDIHAFQETGYDKRLVTRLIDNYRSVENVLSLPSKMFYENSLVPKVTGKEEWIAIMLDNIADLLPNDNKSGGIFMTGIRGVNCKDEDSPSWYNPQEASMVLMYTCKLYKRHISPEDIGIITPYLAQIRYLRHLFDAAGAEQPKIGSVEEFQGQERPIILISTVRSSELEVNSDIKHSLGFVANPKRINVAITRAQVAVMLFGNPYLLCQDLLWRTIVHHVVATNCYTGCDLPSNLLDVKK